MSKNKIIIIFVALVIVISCGFFFYNHQQKVSMAQFYYNSGDYKKAADLKIRDISKKADELNNAKNWRSKLIYGGNDKLYNLQVNGDTLYLNILSIHDAILYNDDKTFVSKISPYYKEIADYLNTSTTTLDKIAEMNYQEAPSELYKYLNGKNN